MKLSAEITINYVTERIQDSYVNEVVNAEVPEIPLSDKKIGSNKKVNSIIIQKDTLI